MAAQCVVDVGLMEQRVNDDDRTPLPGVSCRACSRGHHPQIMAGCGRCDLRSHLRDRRHDDRLHAHHAGRQVVVECQREISE